MSYLSSCTITAPRLPDRLGGNYACAAAVLGANRRRVTHASHTRCDDGSKQCLLTLSTRFCYLRILDKHRAHTKRRCMAVEDRAYIAMPVCEEGMPSGDVTTRPYNTRTRLLISGGGGRHGVTRALQHTVRASASPHREEGRKEGGRGEGRGGRGGITRHSLVFS